jgi:ADP-ribosylation factor-like protein 2
VIPLNEKLVYSKSIKKTRAMLLKSVVNSSIWPQGTMLKYVVFGLSGAGKSTCMDFLSNGVINEPNVRAPTLSFTPYNFDFGKIKIAFVDAPGQESYWISWSKYLNKVNGVIFVIDSTDLSSIKKVNHLLNTIIAIEKSGVPIVFFVNKRDMPKSISSDSIKAMLDLNQIGKNNRSINAFDTSAVKGEGIQQAMAWLLKESYNLKVNSKVN